MIKYLKYHFLQKMSASETYIPQVLTGIYKKLQDTIDYRITESQDWLLKPHVLQTWLPTVKKRENMIQTTEYVRRDLNIMQDCRSSSWIVEWNVWR